MQTVITALIIFSALSALLAAFFFGRASAFFQAAKIIAGDEDTGAVR